MGQPGRLQHLERPEQIHLHIRLGITVGALRQAATGQMKDQIGSFNRLLESQTIVHAQRDELERWVRLSSLTDQSGQMAGQGPHPKSGSQQTIDQMGADETTGTYNNDLHALAPQQLSVKLLQLIGVVTDRAG